MSFATDIHRSSAGLIVRAVTARPESWICDSCSRSWGSESGSCVGPCRHLGSRRKRQDPVSTELTWYRIVTAVSLDPGAGPSEGRAAAGTVARLQSPERRMSTAPPHQHGEDHEVRHEQHGDQKGRYVPGRPEVGPDVVGPPLIEGVEQVERSHEVEQPGESESA